MESRRLLAVFNVTTLADSVDSSDNVVSLREAVLLANANSEDDIIRFDPALTSGGPATIETTSAIWIRSSIAIEGPSANRLTIDGGHGADNQFYTRDGFNIFYVDDEVPGSLSTFELSGVTVTGGDSKNFTEIGSNSGGAIAARENLILRDAVFTRNSGNVGGAVSSGFHEQDSVVEIINCTFSDNAAGLGGGIHHNGTLNVLHSTFSGNQTFSSVGSARAGGISVFGTLRIDHSTITGNSSNGVAGGISWGGITGDFASINHSIVSGNEAPELPNLQDNTTEESVFGRFQGDYNLIGDGYRTPGVNTILSDDPRLGPLTNNGGPVPTHVPLATSLAIDSGAPSFDGSTLPVDQRGAGFQRVADGDVDGLAVIDIGATEFQTSPNVQPSFTLGSNPNVLEDSGPVSIPGFATFDPGHPNEIHQEVLQYHLSNLQRPDLFAVAPMIDTAGTLSFTPRDDVFGTTTIDVVVQDTGGTADGGVDTSASQRFTITIRPVNDAPSFVADPPPPVAAGAGTQTLNGFVRSVHLGAANESNQSIIGYSVTVKDIQGVSGDFFQTEPTIDVDGNLSYAVLPDVLSGTATLQISVQDSGGTLNGGVDTSVPQEFTVLVLPTDFGDAPAAYPVTQSQDGARHVTGSLRLGDEVDGEFDGVPSDTADSDAGDDGVHPIASLLGVADVTTISSLQILASDQGRLNAWIDFNHDGDWDDAGEQIATGLAVTAGSNTLSFEIPGTAVPGDRVARFRLSTSVSLSPTGLASDGEVEDYLQVVLDSSTEPEVVVQPIKNWTSISLRDGQVVVREPQADLFAAPIENVASLRVEGTESDDTVLLRPTSESMSGKISIHTGSGYDRVLFTGGDGDLDLTDSESFEFSGVGMIDLGSDHSNTLVVDAEIAKTHGAENEPLFVQGGEGDAIDVEEAGDWVMGDSQIANGVFIRSVVHTEESEARINFNLPRPYQNLLWAADVNNSRNVSPIDALLVINDLARGRIYNTNTNQLNHPVVVGRFSGHYVDVNGDDYLSPLDALTVINEIVRREAGIQGEGEAMLEVSSDDVSEDAIASSASPQRSQIALLNRALHISSRPEDFLDRALAELKQDFQPKLNLDLAFVENSEGSVNRLQQNLQIQFGQAQNDRSDQDQSEPIGMLDAYPLSG